MTFVPGKKKEAFSEEMKNKCFHKPCPSSAPKKKKIFTPEKLKKSRKFVYGRLPSAKYSEEVGLPATNLLSKAEPIIIKLEGKPHRLRQGGPSL